MEATHEADATRSDDVQQQPACVLRLQAALNELGDALEDCRTSGMEPADAFRGAGVNIPSYMSPALNMMFRPAPVQPDGAAEADALP